VWESVNLEGLNSDSSLALNEEIDEDVILNRKFHFPIRWKMECSIQLGFALFNRTFHLSPHENILAIAHINIHYLYNIPMRCWQKSFPPSRISRAKPLHGKAFVWPERDPTCSHRKLAGASYPCASCKHFTGKPLIFYSKRVTRISELLGQRNASESTSDISVKSDAM
jgi:hypothetical protein